MADFDYIIVGAGSAGCVLANRLSKDPQNRVLLLEAGPPDRHWSIHIPIAYPFALERSEITWPYSTEAVAKANHRQFFYPRGKVLGGSSSLNGMLYVRGQPEDFDGWAAAGNTGWAWKDVLPYYMKSEDQARGASEFHGSGGLLRVSDIEDRCLLSDAVIDAGMEAGLPLNEDVNDGQQEGISYFQLNTRNGRRCSSAIAFLNPARKRKNLVIITEAMVKKINIKNQKIESIIYIKHGKKFTVNAKHEIIVSAGALNSPQLLQCSGIGDAETLKKAGLSPVHHLPGVGLNLQEHYFSALAYRVAKPITINDRARGFALLKEIFNYLIFRKGMLTNSSVHVQAFFKSRPELDRPDSQIHFFPFSPEFDPAKTVQTKLEKKPGMMMTVSILRPESRGSIRIASADTSIPPLIQPNCLDATKDRQVLLDALKYARRIMSQAAIEPYIAEELAPGSATQSDDELLNYITNAGSAMYHSAGTCKMGSDELAVVDSRLRVHGIVGLRVADASIMPTITSGNTNAPCIMIGEKAADMILEDNR